MATLFISQELLDEWIADRKSTMRSNRLILHSTGLADANYGRLDGEVFTVHPAVRFVRVSGGDSDPHELINTVVTEERLAAMGADLYQGSVIHGDVAYDVQCGFLGNIDRSAGELESSVSPAVKVDLTS